MIAFDKTMRGVIRNGKVELFESTSAPDGTEVVVSIPKPRTTGGRPITFGMFAPKAGEPFSEVRSSEEREQDLDRRWAEREEQ